MKVQWQSFKGQGRHINQDAGGACIVNGWLVAMIVDEATSSSAGSGLAMDLVTRSMDEWQVHPIATPEHVTAILRSVHASIRKSHVCGKAAYALIMLDLESGEATALFCGDCRVGRLSAGDVHWATHTHTLDAALADLGHISSQSVRKVLTRSFNAKRFTAPDVVPLGVLADEEAWVMTTDGCIEQDGKLICAIAEDDASCLSVFPAEICADLPEDVNWYMPVSATTVDTANKLEVLQQ
ncbi:MAG: hypothetical protein ACN6OZ_00395 [Stenotrophomonas sp.]|jgi:serine/threonine protein phosphatase PrpC|uniref:hypothetical protein n=1 Tax=Stenotrophomonas indicatrix TaxID=2045451 RepID=UPI000C1A73DB|nr:hypothetical protein [Stenotrophomonas indicatrix]PII13975.1 hypothetical protein CR920_19195 [Stenotrophomonas indicatrix]